MARSVWQSSARLSWGCLACQSPHSYHACYPASHPTKPSCSHQISTTRSDTVRTAWWPLSAAVWQQAVGAGFIDILCHTRCLVQFAMYFRSYLRRHAPQAYHICSSLIGRPVGFLISLRTLSPAWAASLATSRKMNCHPSSPCRWPGQP